MNESLISCIKNLVIFLGLILRFLTQSCCFRIPKTISPRNNFVEFNFRKEVTKQILKNISIKAMMNSCWFDKIQHQYAEFQRTWSSSYFLTMIRRSLNKSDSKIKIKNIFIIIRLHFYVVQRCNIGRWPGKLGLFENLGFRPK